MRRGGTLMDETSDEQRLRRLESYFHSRLPDLTRLTSLTKFAVGQSNPTYLLSTDTGSYVLRSKPPGKLLKSAEMSNFRATLFAGTTAIKGSVILRANVAFFATAACVSAVA